MKKRWASWETQFLQVVVTPPSSKKIVTAPSCQRWKYQWKLSSLTCLATKSSLPFVANKYWVMAKVMIMSTALLSHYLLILFLVCQIPAEANPDNNLMMRLAGLSVLIAHEDWGERHWCEFVECWCWNRYWQGSKMGIKDQDHRLLKGFSDFSYLDFQMWMKVKSLFKLISISIHVNQKVLKSQMSINTFWKFMCQKVS